MQSTSSPTSSGRAFVTSVSIELRPVSSKTEGGRPKSTDSQQENPSDLEGNDAETTAMTSLLRHPPMTGETSAERTSVTFAPEPMRTSSTSVSLTPQLSFTSSRRSSRDPRRWSGADGTQPQKGVRGTLKKLLTCSTPPDALYDSPMPVTVFGATGLIGGAVARALLNDRRFEVKAVTRTPTTDVARQLAEEGAVIVTADMNDARSVTRAVEGAHVVFLVTHYWQHLDRDKEITQGKNCVDAALSAGVAHLVLCGADSVRQTTGKQCAFMDSKAVIENYLKSTALPYTALRLPFFFENLLGVFKPHRVKPGVFALALPVGEAPLQCAAIRDVGGAVLRLLLRPAPHLGRVLHLPSHTLTLRQLTHTLNRHLTDRKFFCPQIRVEDYESFDFDGAKDIAAMFLFYQQCQGRQGNDLKATRKVQGSLCSFDRWVAENKQRLMEAMDDWEEEV